MKFEAYVCDSSLHGLKIDKNCRDEILKLILLSLFDFLPRPYTLPKQICIFMLYLCIFNDPESSFMTCLMPISQHANIDREQ